MNNYLRGSGWLALLLLLPLGLSLGSSPLLGQSIEVVSQPYRRNPMALGDSAAMEFSADHRYAAFLSGAKNLTPNLTNGYSLDLFVRDLVGKSNILVSVNASGTSGGNSNSTDHSINADGHLLLFTSDASDLVAGDTNAASDVFLRDWAAAKTELVSVSSSREQAKAASGNGTFTPDGRYAIFESYSSNLVSGVNFTPGLNLFRRDRATQTTEIITTSRSNSANAAPLQGTIGSYAAEISSDGRYVAFQSSSTNLLVNRENQFTQIYLYDAQRKTNALISLGKDGLPGNNASSYPVLF